MNFNLICVGELFTDVCFFFSSRRRHTRLVSDWSSDVCSSDLLLLCRRRQRQSLTALQPCLRTLTRIGVAVTSPITLPRARRAENHANRSRRCIDRKSVV